MTLSTPLSFSFPEGISSSHLFKISINPDFISQTQAKVETWRPPIGLWSEWTNEGPPLEQLKDITEYWKNKYDWSSIQTRMNQEVNHYATMIKREGDDKRGPKSSSLWSIILRRLSTLWLEICQGLNLVQLQRRLFRIPTKTERSCSLMKQLGYSKYGIVSTDLGWQISMCMVVDVQENIIGHMTDFFPVIPDSDDLSRKARNETTEEENVYLAAFNEWFTSHSACSEVHTQKPLALSLAFTDSPIGFLGWMWDLMNTSFDGYKYSYEELITDAMILYIPGPYRNIRLYLESLKPDKMSFPKSTVPTGVSEWGNGNGTFPELASFQLAPRSWVERSANVAYFARHPSGRHFPAIAHPEEWVQDAQNFF
ncbi:related to epoxide hydrolase [Fusarium mangiferae]|uniref:Related to epoxide hydrolase n=1 Tax=Fusarium mangiferae TaxID=192010 RepID=A0A1L7SY12_FUSMA|nr:uncharacterized protein FMAN_05309 [Fusarium mangiferae]CVK87867.1 related to epoxide hydrolase [Fusarium mangiferae]